MRELCRTLTRLGTPAAAAKVPAAAAPDQYFISRFKEWRQFSRRPRQDQRDRHLRHGFSQRAENWSCQDRIADAFKLENEQTRQNSVKLNTISTSGATDRMKRKKSDP